MKRPCAQTYHFTSDEWAHGILLVAGSKSGNGVAGGNKQKAMFLSIVEKKS